MTLKSEKSQHKNLFRRWIIRILLGGVLLLLLLVLITWIAGRSAKAALSEQHPAPGELIAVGDHKLHIDCMGQGSQTVIMDAGSNDFSLIWALVQPEVASFARVCVYDRAGLGWSEASPEPRTSEAMVQELHSLLNNAAVEPPFVLVGHSFGGVNMRLYAHLYSEEVSGLVLVDSAHVAQMVRVPALIKSAEQAANQFRSLASMSSFGLLALSPEEIPNRNLPESVLPQYRSILATTVYFQTAAAETDALATNLAQVRAANIISLGDLPLIVLSRGLGDPLQGAAAAENQQLEQAWQAMQAELAALSSSSEQVIAEQSGHYIQLDQPQLVIDAIRQIVQTIQE